MVSTGSIPWYNRPPREFPAQEWLRLRYPFIVSPAVFARRAAQPAPAWRPFPALLWLAEHQSSLADFSAAAPRQRHEQHRQC